jgi:hypothetical protein
VSINCIKRPYKEVACQKATKSDRNDGSGGQAQSAWESDRSGPLIALTWTTDAQPVTVVGPATSWLMAHGLMAPEAAGLAARLPRDQDEKARFMSAISALDRLAMVCYLVDRTLEQGAPNDPRIMLNQSAARI